MKAFFILLVGIVLGAAAVWFYSTKQGKSVVRATGEQIESTTKSARDTVQEKLRVFDLRPEQVKDDLARTGQVVRRIDALLLAAAHRVAPPPAFT